MWGPNARPTADGRVRSPITNTELIRFLGINCAFEVLGSADGADCIGVEAGLAPGVDSGRFKGSVVGVLTIRPVMAPQIMPKVFDRIEFW